MGKVSVFILVAPANISVAPNSPSSRYIAKTQPLSNERQTRGISTRKNVFSGVKLKL